jgi:hypothetical protein
MDYKDIAVITPENPQYKFIFTDFFTEVVFNSVGFTVIEPKKLEIVLRDKDTLAIFLYSKTDDCTSLLAKKFIFKFTSGKQSVIFSQMYLNGEPTRHYNLRVSKSLD